MTSFKFLGFSSGSQVALTVAQGAQSAQATLAWGQVNGGGQPNASFTITRVDNLTNPQLIAPCGVWFRASNLTGFNVSEPAGDTNVYDPTQHRITYIWDFGDPGYTPRFTPNIPTAWRNTNVAYGKAVAHVFAASGNYAVTCWAIDEAGNWGTATYTFESGGNAGPIRSQAEAFPSAATVCYSPSGNFAGAPAGASLQTTASGVRTALQSGSIQRLLLRRDEVYSINDTTGPLGKRDAQGLYISHYGSGTNAPRINTNRSGTEDTIFMRDLIGGPCAIDGIDFYGDWDATTETGLSCSPFGELGSYAENITLHRCAFSGFTDLSVFKAGNATIDAKGFRIFNDSVVTNWKDYGNLGNSPHFAIIGCDFAQHVDALTGIDQGGDSQSQTNLGNTHGPFRGGSLPRHLFFSCSSFFSRNGWSSFGSTANGDYTGNNGAPTTCQATFRFTPSPVTIRVHQMHERCSHESGGQCAAYATLSASGDQVDRNAVWDKCLFVASAYSGQFFGGKHPGHTIRNCFFYRPNVPRAYESASFAVLISQQIESGVANLTGTPSRYYNNTAWLAGPTSNTGTPNPVLVSSNGVFVEENNILYAPEFTTPIGAGFSPIGTSPLAGFQCRYKGGRWNFPPIGSNQMVSPKAAPNVFIDGAIGWQIPASTRREQPGSPGVLQPGTVAVGESVILPYPNYTGLSGGALGQVTQAICQSNSTQRHQVSVTGIAPRMGDMTMWPDADGRVAISFQPTFIRITNNSGSPWGPANCIWVQLDLSDYLMGHRAGTASPAAIPLPFPEAGSSARVAGGAGLWAFDDFFGTLRAGQTVMGAFQPPA